MYSEALSVYWSYSVVSLDENPRVISWSDSTLSRWRDPKTKDVDLSMPTVVGWMVASLPDRSISESLEAVNKNLFQMRIFADIVRLKISRWGHPAQSGWAPSSRASVLLRDKHINSQRQKYRRKGLVKEEAEEVIESQASNTMEPPEAGRSGRRSALRACKGRDCSVPADILIWFWTSDLQNCQGTHFRFSKPARPWWLGW